MLDDKKYEELVTTAANLRIHLLNMMGYGKKHHFGGSLSIVEIVTALYFYKMRYDSENYLWEDRDRFILSKGHCVPAQYAALALLGVIPMNQLKSLKQLGSILQGHPNANLTPGIEAFTGCLGQGLSFGNGVALASKILNRNIRTYVVIGDGELHEGQIWEAAMTTATHNLKSLTAIIDNNQLKSQGKTSEAKVVEPLTEKWEAFGWHAVVIDGHDLRQICMALDLADENTRPTVIIANTVKGKGISFMENKFEYHNASITKEQLNCALEEVSCGGQA